METIGFPPHDECGWPDYPACEACGRNPGLEGPPVGQDCHTYPPVKAIDGAHSTLAGHDEAASSAVKSRMDWAEPSEWSALADAYPLEWDEWLAETAAGLRKS